MRVLGFVLVMAMVAVACSSGSSNAAPTTSSPPTTAAVAEEPTPAATLGDLGGPIIGDAPATLPSITVDGVIGNDALAPGWTVFNVRRFALDDSPPLSFVVTLDEAGDLVWAVENDGFVGDVTVTSAGTLIYIVDDHTLREVDSEGRVLREYVSDATPAPDLANDLVTAVDVETFHHEVAELTNGNLMVLTSQSRIFEVEGPMCDEDPATFDGTYKVVGDEVVEFERDTGEVVSRRSLFDVFDPLATRGSDFCTFGAPFGPFPDDPEANDWSHANAASVGPDGELVVSIRHLDALVAWPIADPEAEPLWVFGPGGTIEAAGDDAFVHQHAPEMQPDGSVLLYDNGNNRTDADGEFVDPPFSRVAQYRLGPADDGVGTAELLWEYRRESRGIPVFAQAVGDVDRLDNGNTLITDGFIGLQRAEIAEVDPEGELLRLVTVEADDANWLVYRAERIPPWF